MSASRKARAYRLVLADGEVFEGEGIGADPVDGIASGEVVFNTVLCGYQEVITDPSYAGQIIAFTYPHLGNYGVNSAPSVTWWNFRSPSPQTSKKRTRWRQPSSATGSPKRIATSYK